MEWINVKNELPKLYECVLCFTPGKSFDDYSYNILVLWKDNKFYDPHYGGTSENRTPTRAEYFVSHWLLPDLPNDK